MTIDIKDGLLQIFDVDHGACALLTMPGGRRVLIDCGHSAKAGAPWHPGAHLAGLGIKHVDALICTNYDEDHASGAPSLVQYGINVSNVLGNPTVPAEVIEHLKTEDGMGNGIRVIANSLVDRKRKSELQLFPDIPNVGFHWFANPWPTWDDENNLSFVICLSVYGWNFLFPGDLETKGFENMLRCELFTDLMPSIHVLMASHHGRENGKCEAMFDAFGCSPQLVVISDCAKQYQSQETVPFYRSKANGIANFRGENRWVLTTRQDGEIHFLFEGGRCLAL